MASEGEFPKTDGDILYASEINLALPYPYGDASDGDVVISSNTDIGTTIKNYNNLTINAGVTLTVGHKSIIYVAGTLTVTGDIVVDTVASGGSSSYSGGNGGDSGGSVMIFANEIAGVGSISSNGLTGSNGGTSTDESGLANDTGDSGTFFDIVPINGSTTTAATGFEGRSYRHALLRMCYSGGAGEGQGTRGGGPSRGGSGGGGGGAGGYIFLLTKKNSSTITLNANGGDGGVGGEGTVSSYQGDGGGGGSFTTNGGDGGANGSTDGGGGGGGAGGYIIIYRDGTSFTTSVTAGAGGAGGTDASAGSAGTAGTTVQYEIF